MLNEKTLGEVADLFLNPKPEKLECHSLQSLLQNPFTLTRKYLAAFI
jgi:hypothetical protein